MNASSARWARVAAGVLVALALVALGVSYVRRAAHRTSHVTGGTALADYRAAGALLADGDLYAINYTYPPAFAIAMEPLSGLSMPVAATAWYVLQLAALAGVAWALSVVLLRARVERPLLVLALSFAACSRFLLNNLLHGNVNSFVLLLVLAAVLDLQARRELRAGAALALAATIKVLPLAFLPWLLVRRAPRAAVAMSAALVALNVAVPAARLGVDRAWEVSAQWFEKAISPWARESASPDARNLALAAVIETRASGIDDLLVKVVLADVLLISFVAIGRAWRDRSLGRWLLDAAILLNAFLLVSPKTWKAHYVWLLPACVVLVAEVVAHWRSRSLTARAFRWTAIAAVLAAALSSRGVLGDRAASAVDALSLTTVTACVTWCLLIVVAWRTDAVGWGAGARWANRSA